MRNRSSATNASLSFADLEQSLESSRKQSFAIDQYLLETEKFLEPPYQYFEVRNESVISVEKELWTALRIMLASLHQVLVRVMCWNYLHVLNIFHFSLWYINLSLTSFVSFLSCSHRSIFLSLLTRGSLVEKCT